MPARTAIVRIGLGVLLVAAAGLKLYGLGVSAVPQVGWFAQPWVQLATAEWELVLGLWLISGSAARWSWLATLVTFLAFAAVSGYLGYIGVASCGCFGAIQASPWWAFGVDMGALALLITVGCPGLNVVRETPGVEGRQATTGFAHILLGAGVLLAVATGVASWLYGSPAAALARLQGTPVYAPAYVDFGTGQPGDVLEREVPVTNWTDEPIRLIGGTTDCSCITTGEMPLTISRDETAVVLVRLKVPRSESGVFTRQVEFRSDCTARPTLRIAIGCRIE